MLYSISKIAERLRNDGFKFYDYQKSLMDLDDPFQVRCMGRRTGKDEILAAETVTRTFLGEKTAIITPTFTTKTRLYHLIRTKYGTHIDIFHDLNIKGVPLYSEIYIDEPDQFESYRWVEWITRILKPKRIIAIGTPVPHRDPEKMIMLQLSKKPEFKSIRIPSTFIPSWDASTERTIRAQLNERQYNTDVLGLF